MPDTIEDRVAHLEEAVNELKAAAASEASRRRTNLWIRLAVLAALVALYAYSLNYFSGTLAGR